MLTYELRAMTQDERRALLQREGVDLREATNQARQVIDEVRQGGDEALRRMASRFDGFGAGSLTLDRADLKAAEKRIDPRLLKSLKTSRTRIEAFHRRQQLKPFAFRDTCGVFGQKIVPLDRVGVYVPGGTAAYASSVLMACVPAKMAGVKEIALCTPGKEGKVSDAILAAASICRVGEVHPVGGAHAIAAMAYGTESVHRVRKIVGPGGAIVSAAKLLVRNDCEIDFLAGPSEVLIVADAKADAEVIALDMLAQLEHDPFARAVLVTPSRRLAGEAKASLESLLEAADRREIAGKAAEKGAAFVVAKSMREALGFANEYAPEHLLIDSADPMPMLKDVRNAGSVFLGRYSSVAFGDYCAGTNHVLPTSGTAAMKSSLSVYDFLKIIPYQSISARGAEMLASTVDVMARAEGLPAHAEAALGRTRRGRR